MKSKIKLLDQIRHVIRLKHMSIRTEEAYVQWVRRFILFHHKRHPAEMGAEDIRAFLTSLAGQGQVAASTQHVALHALLFLYRDVLKQPLSELGEIERARRPRRVPVVFTREEVHSVLDRLEGTPRVMASLLYGAGLRLMECVRLRVKDIDFAYQHITVREGKGAQDRVTMLPQTLAEPLRQQLLRSQWLHTEDLAAGAGEVYLPYALARKDPGAGQSWEWQYVFPASKRSLDPRAGIERRHHLSETVLQKAVKPGFKRS
ncbi:MAG: integron integrase [Candidatus Tectimicrobiota bacterium]